MIKKFTINCNFTGQKAPVDFYIGDPALGTHPLNFQNRWLNAKGGEVPKNFMDTFTEIQKISERNKVSFEELCTYVLEEIRLNKEIEDQSNKK